MGENMDEITILIIEDDEDIRESVKILLENEGFHVIEADNGMDGLRPGRRLCAGYCGCPGAGGLHRGAGTRHRAAGASCHCE